MLVRRIKSINYLYLNKCRDNSDFVTQEQKRGSAASGRTQEAVGSPVQAGLPATWLRAGQILREGRVTRYAVRFRPQIGQLDQMIRSVEDTMRTRGLPQGFIHTDISHVALDPYATFTVRCIPVSEGATAQRLFGEVSAIVREIEERFFSPVPLRTK
jgi:hypothetical protein